MQAVAGKHDASLYQRLVVARHRADDLLARHDAGLRILIGFDDDHEFHCRFSWRCSVRRDEVEFRFSMKRRTRKRKIDMHDKKIGVPATTVALDLHLKLRDDPQSCRSKAASTMGGPPRSRQAV